MIAKISEGQLCLREEKHSFNNNYIKLTNNLKKSNLDDPSIGQITIISLQLNGVFIVAMASAGFRTYEALC